MRAAEAVGAFRRSCSGARRGEHRWQKLGDHCHRGQPAVLEVGSMKNEINAIDDLETQYESTYALLLRSEERGRNLFEIVVYPLLIIGVIIAICQFVFQAVDMPSKDVKTIHRVTNASRYSISSLGI